MTLCIPAGMKVLLAGSSSARALVESEPLDSVRALRAAIQKAVHPELSHKVPLLPTRELRPSSTL